MHANEGLVFDEHGDELTEVAIVCRGHGHHREVTIGRWWFDGPGKWTCTTLERLGVERAARSGLSRDVRGTWTLACPRCPRRRNPPKLSALNLVALLTRTRDTGLSVLDLAQLPL